MACLAIGTPVILLYNSAYEDVRRFAPMDAMVRACAEEDFLRELRLNGLPQPPVPADVAPWQDKLRRAVASGLAWAETARLPLVSPEEARRWRVAVWNGWPPPPARKIRTLEEAQYRELHGKLGLVMREEAVKAALEPLLAEPEVVRALTRVGRRRALAGLPWYRRALAACGFRREKDASSDPGRGRRGDSWPAWAGRRRRSREASAMQPVRILGGRAGQLLPQLLPEIGRAHQAGKRVLLLVPEQYTLQAERELIDGLSLPGLIDLDVLSPRRLSQRIRERGGRDRCPR